MVIISMGSNSAGLKGEALDSFDWAIKEINNGQISVIAVSSFYYTQPLGENTGPQYTNAALLLRTALSARTLLKTLKRIEAGAGRKVKRLRIDGEWQDRPLDLDIIDYKGEVSLSYDLCRRFWPDVKRQVADKCGLVLPHPQADLRPFVLRPIMDIAPLWHHPVSGLSVQTLWRRLRPENAGQVVAKIG